MQDKDDLRAHAHDVRARLPLQGDEGEEAATQFLAAFPPRTGQVVALYRPINLELSTFPLMEQLHQAGVIVALPVIEPSTRTLAFHRWAPDTPMTPGPFGIPAPVADETPLVPEIIVTPLLAFDRRGTRLGTGGGYYDRTIAQLRAAGHAPTIIGYAYAEQICLFPLPREGHDIPLDAVVTPQGVQRFRSR